MNMREVDAFPAAVRLNHIQVLGTHNSYHIAPEPELVEALLEYSSRVKELCYSHPPLRHQLEVEKVRQLELDVYADPKGGLFSKRAGLALIGRDTRSHEPKLDEPGFKVLHIPHIDFGTTCLTLKDGLTEIREWSKDNPGHIPIMVLVEVKGRLPELMSVLEFSPIVVCSPQELDALDREILEVFPREQLILPDDIRCGQKTLEDGLLKFGWPTLQEAAGRVFFALDNTDRIRDLYLEGRPALEGRVMFTSSLPGTPSAAFIKANNPLGEHGEQIKQWVRDGYLVRTMADPPLAQRFPDNLERPRAAFASGAHFVSTDFPRPHSTGYTVRLPGSADRPARLNPISGFLQAGKME